ncbi:hypothetical protein RRF57_011554 [Xylaria bambusicola]|uniref:Uncharacterized protein n=1 Tax=Xylaria bambusicola TaxID=326684 RepID=A0AAN7ZA44_9PEZI
MSEALCSTLLMQCYTNKLSDPSDGKQQTATILVFYSAIARVHTHHVKGAFDVPARVRNLAHLMPEVN